jgi:hypothetical protein
MASVGCHGRFQQRRAGREDPRRRAGTALGAKLVAVTRASLRKPRVGAMPAWDHDHRPRGLGLGCGLPAPRLGSPATPDKEPAMRARPLGSPAAGRSSTGMRAGRDRGSRGVELEQFDNDSLFGLCRCGARATAPGCPVSEVGRGRAAVVLEARIGTGAQERLHSNRTSISDSSMQWCHTAGRGRVGVSARADEIENDLPLACRVPACRAGDADHRRVQGFGAPPVSGPDVGAACDQVSRHLGVVTEPRGMQRGVAFVELRETLGRKNSSPRASPAVASDGVALRRSTAVLWSRFAIATSNLVRSVVPATANACSLATG